MGKKKAGNENGSQQDHVVFLQQDDHSHVGPLGLGVPLDDVGCEVIAAKKNYIPCLELVPDVLVKHILLLDLLPPGELGPLLGEVVQRHLKEDFSSGLRQLVCAAQKRHPARLGVLKVVPQVDFGPAELLVDEVVAVLHFHRQEPPPLEPGRLRGSIREEEVLVPLGDECLHFHAALLRQLIRYFQSAVGIAHSIVTLGHQSSCLDDCENFLIQKLLAEKKFVTHFLH